MRAIKYLSKKSENTCRNLRHYDPSVRNGCGRQREGGIPVRNYYVAMSVLLLTFGGQRISGL